MHCHEHTTVLLPKTVWFKKLKVEFAALTLLTFAKPDLLAPATENTQESLKFKRRLTSNFTHGKISNLKHMVN